MCSITAYDRQQPTYVDDARSAGGIAIPKNETTSFPCVPMPPIYVNRKWLFYLN